MFDCGTVLAVNRAEEFEPHLVAIPRHRHDRVDRLAKLLHPNGELLEFLSLLAGENQISRLTVSVAVSFSSSASSFWIRSAILIC
jgi:hypothetical protein